MNSQRGVAVVAILYIVAALAFVGAGYGVVHSYNSALKEVETTKAALAKCVSDFDILKEHVDKQNKALNDLKQERDAANKRADKAMTLANQEIKRNEPERKRLEVLERTFKATGPCPAGEAVREVRKGLRP